MVHLLYIMYIKVTMWKKISINQCLAEPRRAHYGGGLIVNPEFNRGLEGWTAFGQGAVREATSKEGNNYIVAYCRTNPLDSFSQKVQLEKGKLYSLSGKW